jgi:hypothetical protein
VFTLPIIPHHVPHPSEGEVRAAERLAEQLTREDPALAPPEWLRPLVPGELRSGPTLHLDDLSAFTTFGRFADVAFLQDRARFRAGEGDFVASCTPRMEVFEAYCRDRLGLGPALWLHPKPRMDPRRVAAACWTDRAVRQTLLRALRKGQLAYVHPQMGSRAVWITASLMRRATRRRLEVIAPHPSLSSAVNDKAWFKSCARRLFGEECTPRSLVALNFATLALAVQHLARDSRRVVIKIPDSAGGAGNIVLDGARFRDVLVGEIRRTVHELTHHFAWRHVDHLLVSSWESDVLCAPSTQLWIPPERQGPPLVEGVFDQVVDERQGHFLGSRPAHLCERVIRECVDRSWLLARLFQRLGYVGRCSFDLLLVGDDQRTAQVKLVECNGRWGGTSGPMTLMNRLFGDWTSRRYATMEVSVAGLEALTFPELLDVFADDLYDHRTGEGRLVVYNPHALTARASLDLLVMGSSREEVRRAAAVEFPSRIEALVSDRVTVDRSRRDSVSE